MHLTIIVKDNLLIKKKEKGKNKNKRKQKKNTTA
jgi:hypothetical protein